MYCIFPIRCISSWQQNFHEAENLKLLQEEAYLGAPVNVIGCLLPVSTTDEIFNVIFSNFSNEFYPKKAQSSAFLKQISIRRGVYSICYRTETPWCKLGKLVVFKATSEARCLIAFGFFSPKRDIPLHL